MLSSAGAFVNAYFGTAVVAVSRNQCELTRGSKDRIRYSERSSFWA